MILRPFLYDESSCASYLFGCDAQPARSRRSTRRPRRPVPRRAASYRPRRSPRCSRRTSRPITSPAFPRSWRHRRHGLPPGEAGVDFPHQALADGDEVELGNTLVRALATPGHAPAHHAYLVSDLRRGTRRAVARLHRRLPAGRRRRPARSARGGRPRGAGAPSARLARAAARAARRRGRLPSHYAGSVCGRALSANPFSTIGFERRHNATLALRRRRRLHGGIARDTPPRPPEQEAIVAPTAAAPLRHVGE